MALWRTTSQPTMHFTAWNCPSQGQAHVIKALENQEVTCLVLLDLSATFNTIDQNTLLSRMETCFAVTGMALNCFRSYLTDGTQAVVTGDLFSDGSKSASIPLTSGILQGSVLGPILFTLHMVPLGDLYSKNGIKFHLYADDTHIYMTFKPSVPTSKGDCITRIEKCIEEVNIWMSQNLLKLKWW